MFFGQWRDVFQAVERCYQVLNDIVERLREDCGEVEAKRNSLFSHWHIPRSISPFFRTLSFMWYKRKRFHFLNN